MSDFEYALDYFETALPNFAQIYPGYEQDDRFDIELHGYAISVYLTVYTSGDLRFHVTDFSSGDEFEVGEDNGNYKALQLASKELAQVYDAIRNYPLV